MANLTGVLQSRFLPAQPETDGDNEIFNTLLSIPIFSCCASRLRMNSLRITSALIRPTAARLRSPSP